MEISQENHDPNRQSPKDVDMIECSQNVSMSDAHATNTNNNNSTNVGPVTVNLGLVNNNNILNLNQNLNGQNLNGTGNLSIPSVSSQGITDITNSLATSNVSSVSSSGAHNLNRSGPGPGVPGPPQIHPKYQQNLSLPGPQKAGSGGAGRNMSISNNHNMITVSQNPGSATGETQPTQIVPSERQGNITDVSINDVAPEGALAGIKCCSGFGDFLETKRIFFMGRPGNRIYIYGRPYEEHGDYSEIRLGRNQKMKPKEPDQANSIPEIKNGIFCNAPLQDQKTGKDVTFVSATHCEIFYDETGQFHIIDKSSNGTWINDERIPKGIRHALKDQAMVTFGDAGYEIKHTPVMFKFEKVTLQGKDVRSKYDFVSEIGKGNFAVVYMGQLKNRKNDDNQKYAIKCIDIGKFEKFTKNRQTILELESEQAMLRRLSHPHIVQFYEILREQDKLYLITEFLAGGDLLQRILDQGIYAETTSKRIFGEICDALKYMHDQKIIHRDLKPENVLLTSKDENAIAKIGDFGLARELLSGELQRTIGGTARQHQTNAKTFCGTPHYFAPEIILNHRNQINGYGCEVDMWSAGVILFILLVAAPPFDDEGLYEQIINGAYNFEDPDWKFVSENAKDLVRRLMEKDGTIRYNIDQTLEHPWLANYEPSAKRVHREASALGSSSIGSGNFGLK